MFDCFTPSIVCSFAVKGNVPICSWLIPTFRAIEFFIRSGMEDYLRSYLRSSSAHGFGYLAGSDQHPTGVGGRTCLRHALRIAWLAAIAVSFTLSALLVISSLRDTQRNPVLTTTDYVPIQVHLV